ncbi:M43 family zinc metalloprotease [Arthrobacter sp. SA17]
MNWTRKLPALFGAALLWGVSLAALPLVPAEASPPPPPADHAEQTPTSVHTFEDPPAPLRKGESGPGGLSTESFSLARSGDIKVTLVTVQLADKSATETASISLPAAYSAIDTASRYWKTMSNNRLSLSVASTRTGVKSSAASWQSYTEVMNTVSRELGWVSQPYTALVVFVATPHLSSGALGAGWSTNGTSGRVLMPLPGSLTNSVVTHEFGHVLGLMHADSLQCTSGARDVASLSDGSFADPSCSVREYGDTMDLMGASQTSQPTISSSLWQYGGFGRGTRFSTPDGQE